MYPYMRNAEPRDSRIPALGMPRVPHGPPVMDPRFKPTKDPIPVSGAQPGREMVDYRQPTKGRGGMIPMEGWKGQPKDPASQNTPVAVMAGRMAGPSASNGFMGAGPNSLWGGPQQMSTQGNAPTGGAPVASNMTSGPQPTSTQGGAPTGGVPTAANMTGGPQQMSTQGNAPTGGTPTTGNPMMLGNPGSTQQGAPTSLNPVAANTGNPESANQGDPNTIGGGPPWDNPIPRIDQTDPEGRMRIEDALMARYHRLADPYFSRQEDRLTSRLANRGLPTTGEAYQDEFGQFHDAQNRSFADAADRAIMAGTAEDQRLWQNQFSQNQLGLQENLGHRSLDVQMRGQDIQEMLGRAGIDMRGQELTAQQAIARMQMEAQQGNAAAQMELARLQNDEARRQFDLNYQFRTGQTGWENAFNDRNWQFNAGITGRNQFFNEMGSFFPGTPTLGMPQIPYLDAQGAWGIGAQTDANRYQGQYDMWNSANQYNAGLWGGFFDLAGAGIGAWGGG